MAISIETSRRIAMLRFPLIIGVVFIHAYGFKVSLANGSLGLFQMHPLVVFIEDYISQVLARICVPLFYLISGFLFFVSYGGTAKQYLVKIRSRVRTLLIPFLFWNILSMALLALAQSNPCTSNYFSGTFTPILSFGPYDFLNAVFGLTRSPVAYQFWFIRDLMILVLLSPVFYFLMRYFAWTTLLLLMCAWMTGFCFISMPSSEATLFFFIGGTLACYGMNLDVNNRVGRWAFLIYIVISLIDVVSKHTMININVYVHNVGIFVGTISVIWLAGLFVRINNDGHKPRWFVKKYVRILKLLSPVAFFVFAAHEPLLTVIKKLGFYIYKPSNSFAVLALYLIAPVLTMLICIFIYFIIRRTMPVFTHIICGGR